jgi:hypothetical protein
MTMQTQIHDLETQLKLMEKENGKLHDGKIHREAEMKQKLIEITESKTKLE